MDLGSLLVIFALAIVVVAYIARPFIEKRKIPIVNISRYNSELRAETDQILMNLQEMDMDHAMGKIPIDEYQARRTSLVARGAAILKELDRLNGVSLDVPIDSAGTNDHNVQDLEAQVEREIRQRRGIGKGGDAGYCPQCGTKFQAGDRFCTRCGSEVYVAEAEA
jgi:hypothetical protein